MRLGGAIERRLERRREVVDDRLLRPPHAGRRHQSGAELDDDLLPLAASAATFVTSIVSSVSPAVFARWLWHVTQ